MISKNKNQGFTLIELMVVISIISLTTSIVLTTVSDAQARARDVQRINMMDQMTLALELYFDDNGAYPDADPSASGYGKEIHSNQNTWRTSNLHNALVGGGYIAELPVDPQNIGGEPWTGGYTLTYSTYTVGGSPTLGSAYDLTIRLERPNAIACPNTSWIINTETSDNWCNYPTGPPANSRILSNH